MNDTQSLSWPRTWAVNPDAAWQTTYYGVTVVPQRVKDATCELAFQYVNAGTTDLATVDDSAGIIEKTIDVLTTRWDINRKQVGLNRFPRVLAYIRPLLASGGTSVPLIRG